MTGDATVRAWIALGSNLGDRASWLALGRARLGAARGVHIIAASSVEETAPLGGSDQPQYLNQMVLLRAAVNAPALLELCHHIEHGAGRQRHERWAPRTLDLDLVRFGDLLCDGPELSLPHPGLRDREFWAREIAELEAHA